MQEHQRKSNGEQDEDGVKTKNFYQEVFSLE